jgi:hypothetical protein
MTETVTKDLRYFIKLNLKLLDPLGRSGTLQLPKRGSEKYPMRYVITESPDPGERNHCFTSRVAPRFGKRVSVGGRTYEVVDIELCQAGAEHLPLEVRASVRRVA